jgi:hypothetical protein
MPLINTLRRHRRAWPDSAQRGQRHGTDAAINLDIGIVASLPVHHIEQALEQSAGHRRALIDRDVEQLLGKLREDIRDAVQPDLFPIALAKNFLRQGTRDTRISPV